MDATEKGFGMKRILILSNSSGGLYSFRKELIEKLLDLGFEVHISTPRGSRADLLEEMGCAFIETPIDRRGMNPVSDLKLMLNYRQIIKKVDPDIVLTYTIKPNIYGSIACRLAKKPYLNNVTGLGSSLQKPSALSSILLVMYKIAFKNSSMVFFQNMENMDFMLHNGTISGSYKLIPGSGVNLEKFSFAPYANDKNGIIFNYIGRIMKDKGIDEYLAAAVKMRAKYPESCFRIIGQLERGESRYAASIEEMERNGVIEYCAFQKDIIPWLANSHCTIHPSHHEGMSNVLLESAAIGRVLIASDIPGCREIIDNDCNGYTFRAGDVSDLIEKIEKFITLPHEKKAEMGKRSREKVEREFDRQEVIGRYVKQIHLAFQKE